MWLSVLYFLKYTELMKYQITSLIVLHLNKLPLKVLKALLLKFTFFYPNCFEFITNQSILI